MTAALQRPTAANLRSAGGIVSAERLALLLIALPNLAVLDRIWQVGAEPVLRPQGYSATVLTLLHGAIGVGYLIAVPWLFERCVERLRGLLQPHMLLRWVVAAALFGLFAALTLLVYPMVETLGFSSDRDEALDVGVRQLLAGVDPYSCRVMPGEHHACLPAGNPIGPLPGALLLALPFVLLGYAALQSLFWLGLYGWRLLRLAAEPARGLAVMVIAVAAAPILIAEVATGGDLLANAIWVALGFHLLLQRPRLDAVGWLLIVLLGIGFAGRSHFLLIAPLLGMVWVRRHGWPQALTASLTMATVFFALALWFYPGPGQAFGPLLVQQKLSFIAGPLAQSVVLIITVVASISTALLLRDTQQLLLAAAALLAIPPLAAVLLNSWRLGGLSFEFYGWYLLSSLPLALLWWAGRRAPTAAPP